MIEFHFEQKGALEAAIKYTEWLEDILHSEGAIPGVINYIFCSDEKILEMNRHFLNHDYYTDILSFDYSEEELISGDIFISWDRVCENARKYKVNELVELRRVMAHGLLHFLGYKDSSRSEKALMRKKENEKLQMFHVEQ